MKVDILYETKKRNTNNLYTWLFSHEREACEEIVDRFQKFADKEVDPTIEETDPTEDLLHCFDPNWKVSVDYACNAMHKELCDLFEKSFFTNLSREDAVGVFKTLSAAPDYAKISLGGKTYFYDMFERTWRKYHPNEYLY